MIRSEKVPTAVLETVFRQASNSRIITNAHAINHNDTHLQYGDDFQMLEVQNSEEAARLVIKNYLREVAIHGIENVQILSPFRKRGAVASNALNETIRELVNPPNKSEKGNEVWQPGLPCGRSHYADCKQDQCVEWRCRYHNRRGDRG